MKSEKSETTKAGNKTALPRVKARKAAAAARAQRASDLRKLRLEIPPILLEGDGPSPTPVSGVAPPSTPVPTEPCSAPASASAPLPQSYGSTHLQLLARDPYWLHAQWDLTPDQQRSFDALAEEGHLLLRLYRDTLSGQPAQQIDLEPLARQVFVHVGEPWTRFVAELGFHGKGGKWIHIATSEPAITPPETLPREEELRLEAIPVDMPFSEVVATVKTVLQENPPLAGAIQQLRDEGGLDLPPTMPLPPARWTPEQERALAGIVRIDAERRVWLGPLDVTELIGLKLQPGASSAAWAGLGAEATAGQAGRQGEGVSSLEAPVGEAAARRGFWFSVNAELVLYGATEAHAQVTIGGRKIKLRPDGTFSYRFALPDGLFGLPLEATSADGAETRKAEIGFSRCTRYTGDVKALPHDPDLTVPRPENVA
ncbi:MAG: DUF4912 domain-containing protein [Verrucomicrobia bacterium]|nr:DUF4912 domain-containing protein [Verrucomicrobiota bacterium]